MFTIIGLYNNWITFIQYLIKTEENTLFDFNNFDFQGMNECSMSGSSDVSVGTQQGTTWSILFILIYTLFYTLLINYKYHFKKLIQTQFIINYNIHYVVSMCIIYHLLSLSYD